MNWYSVGTTVNKLLGNNNSEHVAAFDFNGTLVWSDNGGHVLNGANDWIPTVNNQKIINFFENLVNNYWTIVILSNESLIPTFKERAISRLNYFITAIQRIVKNFKPYVYISTGRDIYRKPNRGMWDLFLEDFNKNPSEASFYCGDEYGPKSTNKLYTRNNNDTIFASNCGLAYYTPDEILGVFESEFILDPKTDRVLLIMAGSQS